MTIATQTPGPRTLALRAVAAACLAVVASAPAQAVTAVTLCAKPFNKTLPPSVSVPMWGFAVGDCSAEAKAPGTTIHVPNGTDRDLVVTLINQLPVPTSVVIASQSLPTNGQPVMATEVMDAGGSTVCTPDASNRQTCRVRSFTSETAPGGTGTYVFNNLRTGTYLMQSGTHPQVQVQMGLSAMVVVGNDAPSGVREDAEVVLSEVDPAMHGRVAATLGQGDLAGWKAGGSTLDYKPTYFLINGNAYEGVSGGVAATDLNVPGVVDGDVVRLRLANAGLRTRVVTLNSGSWHVMSEDGYDYPSPRVQSTVTLPAAKTSDADLTYTGGRFPALFDRRAGTENAGGTSLGGQVARVVATDGVTGLTMDPIASQVVNEGTAYSLLVTGQGLGGNSDAVFALTVDGSAALLPNMPAMTLPGTTDYRKVLWNPVTANGSVPENHTFTVSATKNGNTVQQSFGVRMNHMPTIGAVTYNATDGGSAYVASGNVKLDGSAADVDGDPIVAIQTGTPLPGLTLNLDGSFTWSGPPADTEQNLVFHVRVRDPYNLKSAAAAMHIIVPAFVAANVGAANAPIEAQQQAGIAPGTQALSATGVPILAYPAAVSANDAIVANSLRLVGVTKVRPNGNPFDLPANSQEATVTLVGGQILLTPRVVNGTVNSGTGANGSYGIFRVTYTVTDKWGRVATAYIFVTASAPA